MRVISGLAKGRRLSAPAGADIRPTTDRVKENIFNILGTRPRQAAVLDLYAGSGALGIEALSRGAVSAVYVDNNVAARKTIASNLTVCRFEEHSLILDADITEALKMLKKEGRKFNLIFLDPPYKINAAELRKVFNELVDCLAEDAVVVLEHGGEISESPATAVELIDSRQYGGTFVSFFARHTSRK